MNRLLCTVENIKYDITAPYLPQLVGFVRITTPGAMKLFRGLAKARGRPIKHMVDVGANIGGYSLAFNAIFPGIEILAIEPSRWNFPHLEHNTKPFPNIKVRKCLIAGKEMLFTIAAPSPEQRDKPDLHKNTGLISIYGNSLHFREDVEAKLLDSVIKKRVDWLKIDVEGAEMDVLEGAKEVLLNHRPVVQLEMRPENQKMAGHPAAAPFNLMRKYGYMVVSGLDADWIYFPHEHKRAK